MMKTILVEVKNEILGDRVFWEGPADKIDAIANLLARATARLVAMDGKSRRFGMWHVSVQEKAREA